ncbi:MAG: GNAT family protein [bacterium]|nr:GNAT family protein [bacterium]
MKLIGKQIILRPIKLSDAEHFVKWVSDPEVNKFTTRNKITLKEELKWIKGMRKTKNTFIFAIDTKDGTHIGSAGIHDMNRKDKNAIFGILIGDKKYWNKGYGTDATTVLLNYGFNKLKLHRIELFVYEYNPRAIKVYKRLGFKLEGIKREQVFYKNKFYDVLNFGILDREYKRGRFSR